LFDLPIKYENHGQEKPDTPDKTRKFSASQSVQRIIFLILPIIKIPYRQHSFGMLEKDILKKPSKLNFKFQCVLDQYELTNW
jgi:hypothetical protein